MPVTQNFCQTMEIIEPKIIPSYLNFPDEEVQETLTMEIRIEKEMMIPEGQRRVATQEDHQEGMIQMMTLMVMKMMTLQMVMATQHQAAIYASITSRSKTKIQTFYSPPQIIGMGWS